MCVSLKITTLQAVRNNIHSVRRVLLPFKRREDITKRVHLVLWKILRTAVKFLLCN